jgi:hypothetical protein
MSAAAAPALIITRLSDGPPRSRRLRFYDLGRRPSWSELCRLEPRLRTLAAEIRAVRDDPDSTHYCANADWYARGGFKDRLCELVGWSVDHPVLGSTEAYDAAYEKLYDLLPDCRDCGCW